MVRRRRGWEGVALEGVLGGDRGGKFREVATGEVVLTHVILFSSQGQEEVTIGRGRRGEYWEVAAGEVSLAR